MGRTIDSTSIAAYEASRDLSSVPFKSACFAPYVSLSFDTLGVVRACCQHSRHHPLGRIPQQSLDEIWNGPEVVKLREALRNYNFDLGCGFCKWQVLDGNYQGVFARHYDWLADDGTWPRVMEFMIRNTCNLECVMCCGEWSHLIRSRREKAPPLPKVYDDRFFEDLRRYLPHLRLAKFAGGEPFLQNECYRIWNMMTELGLNTHCFVTTNGTVYNSKVQGILNRFPTDLAISMDGVTKETFEQVRVNADFDVFLRNIRHFRDYVAKRGTTMNLNICLQRRNWHEFGEFLLFADELDTTAFVCTVTQPASESVYSLPAEQLRHVVQTLEAQRDTIEGKLNRNRAAWDNELARLRHRLEKYDERPTVYEESGSLPNSLLSVVEAPPLSPETQVEEARLELMSWSGGNQINELLVDPDDRIQRYQIEESLLKLAPNPPAIGGAAAEVMGLLVACFGRMELVSESISVNGDDRLFHLGEQGSTHMRAVTIPYRDDAGQMTGRQTLFAMKSGIPSE